MVERGTVVWAPDPFEGEGNPRPWLVVASDRLPYPDDESIAVGLTTQSHHAGSVCVPDEAWVRGKPRQRSYVLPWTVATLKDAAHVAGVQGDVTEDFVGRVTRETISYLKSESSR